MRARKLVSLILADKNTHVIRTIQGGVSVSECGVGLHVLVEEHAWGAGKSRDDRDGP